MMGCSRLLEIQLGTTGLYHGDRYDTRFVSGFSFVYLLEVFNDLLAPHHVFKFIFRWCFPQWRLATVGNNNRGCMVLL